MLTAIIPSWSVRLPSDPGVAFPVQMKGNAGTFLGMEISNEFAPTLNSGSFTFLGMEISNEFAIAAISNELAFLGPQVSVSFPITLSNFSS